MTPIYHVLGSPIPHHNHTILQFATAELQPKLPAHALAKFLVVGNGFAAQYPNLTIEEYADKNAIALALIQQVRQQPQAHFYLHGQFNFPIWIAILLRLLPPERLTWHMWGADLHEDSRQWKFRFAYPLRRFIQKQLRHIVGYQGDLDYFRQRINPQVKGELVYFPSKMDRSFVPTSPKTVGQKSENLTILLGNSGDVSNRHIWGLEQIYQQFGERARVIIPMSYPEHNQDYIQQVRQRAAQLWQTQNAVQILTEKMPLQDYLQHLQQCDVAYFLFERQQGVGSLCSLIQLNIPVVLHRKNTFVADMKRYDVPFLCLEQVSAQSIAETRAKLTALNKEKIEFLAPHFVHRWLGLLKELSQ